MELGKEWLWMAVALRWWCQSARYGSSGGLPSAWSLLQRVYLADWSCSLLFSQNSLAVYFICLFTRAWCTVPSVSAACTETSTPREAISMDSLYLVSLKTCICVADSVTRFYFWYFRTRTHNLWDKKGMEAVIVRCTQALAFPLYFPFFVNNDMLADLPHLLWCAETLYVWERPAKA